MKNCIQTDAEETTLPPGKRVRYSFGMVLGVDDFRQEQINRAYKLALTNRLLHGVGTASGLRVQVAATPDRSDVLVTVSAGHALGPQGRWICVDDPQCARLDQWLQANSASAVIPLAPGPYRIYVVLAYDECPTDLVPVAARACATTEDAQAPSRVAEGFQLGFAWQPPAQPAEEAARALGELLRLVEIVPLGSPASDDGALFIDAVRALAEPMSPPMAQSPALGTFQLPAPEAPGLLHQAQVIWATEVVPQIQTATGDSLLLAALDFALDATGRVLVTVDAQGALIPPGQVGIDESDRPILLSARAEQEWASALGPGQIL
jgi:hypothetical protein